MYAVGSLLVLFVVSIIIETVVETAFGGWLSGVVMRIASLVVSAIVCIAFHLSIFYVLFHLQSDFLYVDYVITSLLLAGGASRFHDFIGKVQGAGAGAGEGENGG